MEIAKVTDDCADDAVVGCRYMIGLDGLLEKDSVHVSRRDREFIQV